ncbi:adhesion G protein-coupled receptor E2 [Biomphalaria glabrata]|nr:adhesion G protein-coupled receptor E2 [Biomphalaria glabrata]
MFPLFSLLSAWTDQNDNYEYQWNKSVAHLDYFLSLCPNVCYEEEKITLITFERCFDIDCFPCDCQKPRCLIYGTCCPEVSSLPGKDDGANSKIADYFSFPLPSEANETNYEQTKLTCSENHRGILLLRSCPDDFTDLRVRQWCEEDLLGQDLEYDKNLMDVLTKVSDPVTGVTYYNKYCAECNNASYLVSWSVKIECYHYLYIYKSLEPNELLRLSLDNASTCNVKDHVPDANSSYLTCDKSNNWFDKVIGVCNITGKWTLYDSDVERLCSQIAGHSFRVRKQSLSYSNVFCAICNSEQYPYLKSHCSFTLPGIISHELPPFTILLNFYGKMLSEAPSKTEIQSCSKEEWPGPGNRCFLIHCAKGKQLRSKRCVTALQEIRGLGYKARLEYTLNYSQDGVQPSEITYNDIFYFSSSLSHWFSVNMSTILEELCLSLNVKSFIPNKYRSLDAQYSPDVYLPSFLVLEVFIITQKEISRDEAEKLWLEMLYQTNITLLVGERVMTLEFVSNTLYRSKGLNCSSTTHYCMSLADICVPTPYQVSKMWSSKQDFLWLDELLTCPFVHFNKTRVQVETLVSADTSTKYMVRIDLDDAEFNFTDKDELKKLSVEEDGAVNVCVDLLDSKLEELQEKLQAAEASESFLSLYVITVICLGVSMVCLLITVVTYISFRTLRSVAGIHTMILSATLLLAQALLLTISHVQAPSIICTVLGVSTHFMWLCMFAWSLICCFHMYTIFTAKVRTTCNTSDSRKHLIVRVLCSFLLPAVIVSIVILVDYFTSDGQRMGYGTRTCYLNSKELILCSVAAPLGAVLLSNVFFFVSSVMEIYKVKKLQSPDMFKKSDRSDLYIYIKLSTMTGVFWLLALLAEGLDNNVLRYISVVMNGLQGMFIFMSYVCNKRVWTLYKEIWSLRQLLDRSEKGTLSQLASEVQAH